MAATLNPKSLSNPLTGLKVASFDEVELFQASAVRYARVPHEGLRRICSDAAEVMRAAKRVQGLSAPVPEDVLAEWLGKLEEAKKAWEEEKRGRRESEKTKGEWGNTKILWLDESEVE